MPGVVTCCVLMSVSISCLHTLAPLDVASTSETGVAHALMADGKTVKALWCVLGAVSAPRGVDRVHSHASYTHRITHRIREKC